MKDNKPICMSENFWMNSPLSTAKFTGGITLSGHDYLIVNKDGKDIYECSYEAAKAGNQDIDHLYMMYERLNVGGELSCIVSQHWKFAEERKCTQFREWLEKHEAEVTDFNNGEFKESGTVVGTSLLYIVKKSEIIIN